MSRLSRRNLPVIHSLWIGETLSRLELLTLTSFVRWGHVFHLWVYDAPKTPLPRGVVLQDASEILPRTRVFRKRSRDAEAGVGEGSVSPFSDLFRYKLLFDKGGVWSDMDITCLRPFDLPDDYVFRPHALGMVGNLMKCPAGSDLMRACFAESDRIANEDVDWHAQIRILNKNVIRMGLDRFIRHDISNLDNWHQSVRAFVESPTPIPDHWHAIHWLNEFIQTIRRDERAGQQHRARVTAIDKDAPPPGGTLHALYRLYGLVDPRAPYVAAAPAAPAVAPRPAEHLPSLPAVNPANTRINLLVHSLYRDGIARIVTEIARATARSGRCSIRIHVLCREQKAFALEPCEHVSVAFHDDLPVTRAFRRVALEVAASPSPLLHTGPLLANHMAVLWQLGVTTVPLSHDLDGIDPAMVAACTVDLVPYAIATSDAGRQAWVAAGFTKPIFILPHAPQTRMALSDVGRCRRDIREPLGVAPATLLVGMVGSFRASRHYTRAVRVLAWLKAIRPTRLVILGDWDRFAEGDRGVYEATCRLALELGVMADLRLPGNVDPVEPWYCAFDVLLDTSSADGHPLAMMEAATTGCPIVTADVGRHRDLLPADTYFVADPADIEGYVDGVLCQAQRQKRWVKGASGPPDAADRLLYLLSRHALPSPTHTGRRSGVLFVTQALDISGPSRSLTLLLSHLPATLRTALFVIDGISVRSNVEALDAAQVPIWCAEGMRAIDALAEAVLDHLDHCGMNTICFWNVRPDLKLLLAKLLAARDTRLIDVSPGPMLFDEMRDSEPYQKRVDFDSGAYFARLDDFVTIYEGGGVPTEYARPRRQSLIRLGTPAPRRFVPLPPPADMLPSAFDPALAIGTCCRIVPDKRVEFLIDMMEFVTQQLPRASLTIVGGPDATSVDYWHGLRARVDRERIASVRFVGPRDDVSPFLRQFRLFVMVANRQGCPNASLEAMAEGVPVIANPDGGTGEQVVDGITGYLADTPGAMAARVVELLSDARARRKLGAGARNRAAKLFSVERMVDEFAALLQ